jgi:hypothetical protein
MVLSNAFGGMFVGRMARSVFAIHKFISSQTPVHPFWL